MPLFSIIIPTYNRESLIRKAIDSVLIQTFEDFEIIIIDDGSTDNTCEVVKNYKDQRIKYIYQENAERSAARNNGIKNAKGKYICFLDSDDEYLDNHLFTFNEELKKNNYPIWMLYSKELTTYQIKNDYNNYEKILKFMIHPQEVCIHQKILEEEKFNENKIIGEDFNLWIRIVDKFPLYHINKKTVIIDTHEERSVNYLKINAYQYCLENFKEIYASKRFNSKISKKVKVETISDCYFGIGKHLLYNKHYLKGMINVLKSILHNKSNHNRYKFKLVLLSFINRRKLAQLIESE
tara:strand:- start:8786 stop:9667 length:882 start_codon:yes stop_codon:yes gene_type:complete